ncbi:MAG: SPASM domain-containing protein [Oscillospiraceae bacterium]|jgi:uncharacterized protein|nr:SPASM domain-containing protein [Oscillospiraceae bacterium]
MQYTLHLTQGCNFACKYCGLAQAELNMSRETAFAAVDLALAEGDTSVGIGFYGGEPLLCKSLIYDIVKYGQEQIGSSERKIFYKLTTNGSLLDDEFLHFAAKNGLFISLSLDGNRQAHNLNRLDRSGKGTYSKAISALPMLLALNPFTPVMMTAAPNTAAYLADSVQHIFSLGVRNLICSLDYSAQWSESELEALRLQYKKLAEYYLRCVLEEKKLFFSPFESKINSHIKSREYCSERCKLGYDQISVGTDGALYPCIQFVGDSSYQIGHVSSGIEQTRRKEIFKQSRTEHKECQGCALKKRCLHTCACINKYSTVNISQPSPVLCAHERMLIPIADGIAARLYKKRSGLFIQQHYNKLYPLISLAEDFVTQQGGKL